jgi:transposase-like protein
MWRKPKGPVSPKMQRKAIPEGFNTGRIIMKAMRESGVSQAEIARQTGRNPSTVKEVRRRKSTQASILHEFSIVMGVDLFRPLSDNLPEHIRANPDAATIVALNAEKEALHQQVDDLKAQLAQLREANHLKQKREHPIIGRSLFQYQLKSQFKCPTFISSVMRSSLIRRLVRPILFGSSYSKKYLNAYILPS